MSNICNLRDQNKTKNIISFEQVKMNYITTDNMIDAVQGVSKQSRKCQNSVKITKCPNKREDLTTTYEYLSL